tara:strand:+ start:229 stop:411 length:183 start_codon:yes stop_codon:yes gene_type:complete
MKINKTENKLAIHYLSEIEELIQSEVFSIGDELKEGCFLMALQYSIHTLKKAETLLRGEK